MTEELAATSKAKPRKKRRIFLWVFLAIQVLFIAWVISAAVTGTGPSASDVAQGCDNGAWQGLFTSHADCVKHYAVALSDAGNTGKGIAVALIVVIWVIVDFLVGLTYGIYRLARRPARSA
jgi:hypothetical protein